MICFYMPSRKQIFYFLFTLIPNSIMIQNIRASFNNEFREAAYQAMLKEMNTAFDCPISFRVAETPVFLEEELAEALQKAGNEIADFVHTDEYFALSKSAIPAELYAPNEPKHTGFLIIDFAITKDEDGNWLPQLIELQGFASVYMYQLFGSEMYQKHFSIPDDFSFLFNGYDREKYLKHFGDLLLNGYKAENVILLEIEPYKQKFAIDFHITEQLFGIKSVCISEVILEENQLFYLLNGQKTPIHRIYNRVIFDELLQRPDLPRQFNLTEEVEVEWVSHPNWFFRVSKYTLPFLKNKYVPETHFVSEITTYPSDLENYVLKPLYSFAGQGVILNVTPKDLEKVKDKQNWILQKKVKYAPLLKDLEGNEVKGEIRLLYLYDKALNKCVLVTNWGRLSKSEMVSLSYNNRFKWAGSTTYFFRK